MRSVSYKYQRTTQGVYPIVPVVLHGPNGPLEVPALVDSGAAVSIFDATIARHLGIDLRHERRACAVAADGFSLPYKITRVLIVVGGSKIKARIGFSDSLKVGLNLLGRLDIFGHFHEVTFKEKRKTLEFRTR